MGMFKVEYKAKGTHFGGIKFTFIKADNKEQSLEKFKRTILAENNTAVNSVKINVEHHAEGIIDYMTKLVDENPNDMSLGVKVRKFIEDYNNA